MLYYIIITSLIITGIHATMLPGMLFERFANYLASMLPDWLCMPLFGCIICMASIWGTLAFLLTNFPFSHYVPFVLAVCGMNTIISLIFRLSENESEHL